MFYQYPEPQIHEAVIQNRYAELLKFAQDKDNLLIKNSLGLTALELANYLGKTRCADCLRPPANRRIKMMRAHSTTIEEYNSDEFREFFKITYTKHLRFENYTSLKKVIYNCPWILKTSTLGEENRTLAELYQWEIAVGYSAESIIKWIDPAYGYGLFTSRELKEGAFIGEYTGVVRQLHRLHADHNIYCLHYPTRLWSWNYFIIDAQEIGNTMRFVNHSNTPNLKPVCICDRGLLHLAFIANQTITAGTELTFDYGKDFWKNKKQL